jgi:hypothetical protein
MQNGLLKDLSSDFIAVGGENCPNLCLNARARHGHCLLSGIGVLLVPERAPFCNESDSISNTVSRRLACLS